MLIQVSQTPCNESAGQTAENLESMEKLRPCLHGNGSMRNRTRTVRIGLAFTRELMEPFYTELLAVPELVQSITINHKTYLQLVTYSSL